MFIIKIITLILLILIFLQDWKDRSVYWLLFPLLTVLLTGERFQNPTVLAELMYSVLINVSFIAIQLVILTFYFSIKNKKWINLTIGLLGLGDILFLLSIAFYLSVLNFLFFYIISLIGVLLIWLSWQAISRKRQKYIPVLLNTYKLT